MPAISAEEGGWIQEDRRGLLTCQSSLSVEFMLSEWPHLKNQEGEQKRKHLTWTSSLQMCTTIVSAQTLISTAHRVIMIMTIKRINTHICTHARTHTSCPESNSLVSVKWATITCICISAPGNSDISRPISRDSSGNNTLKYCSYFFSVWGEGGSLSLSYYYWPWTCNS